ncbi:MAG TPA: putative 2OG-Fe(II) oxygenase [Alphaproteobacteria bacterium]
MNCPLSAAGPSDSAGLWPSNRLEDGSARAGTMILFPAWLVHSVHTYTGDRPRISVAFNFSL